MLVYLNFRTRFTWILILLLSLIEANILAIRVTVNMHKLSIPFANGISSPKTQRRLCILNTTSLIAYFLFNYSTTLFHFDDDDGGGENWTKNRIKVNRAENYYSILSINIPSIQMPLLKKCWYYHYCFPTIWYSFIF